MDLPYRELPDDVEINEDDQGRFEARRASEPDAHLGFAQSTLELARTVSLAYLNKRAVLSRADECLRGTGGEAPHFHTREQYERACAEVEVIRLPDSSCRRLEYKSFDPPLYDAETIVAGSLATRRCFAILADERRQHKDFERDLRRDPFSRVLTRERYEMMCGLVGVTPAAEEQISDLKVDCFKQEETQGRADVPLILAKWRAGDRYNERPKGV